MQVLPEIFDSPILNPHPLLLQQLDFPANRTLLVGKTVSEVLGKPADTLVQITDGVRATVRFLHGALRLSGVVMLGVEVDRVQQGAEREPLILLPRSDFRAPTSPQCATSLFRTTFPTVIHNIFKSNPNDRCSKYQVSSSTFSAIEISSRPFTCAQPVIPGVST